MLQLKPLRARPASSSLVLALPQTLERNSLDCSKLARGTLTVMGKVCALASLEDWRTWILFPAHFFLSISTVEPRNGKYFPFLLKLHFAEI